MGDDSDAQLEQRVEQVEQQLSKMLPDRRGVLKGLGAAALGGAAVGASTGGASGQSAAGQVGTESEPVDVEGAQGNFDSVSTEELNNATIVEPTDGTAPHGGGIQEAIDIASAGDTLVLKPNTTYTVKGTFSDGPLIELDKDNLTLVGHGPGSLIKLDGTTTATDEGAKIIEIAKNTVGCNLLNFKVDGDYQNVGNISNKTDGHNIAFFGEDIRMEGVYSWYSSGDGVEPYTSCERATVTNCHFKENWEQNVHYHGPTDVVVSNCILHDEINNGMVATFSASGNPCERCTFADNVLIGGQNEGILLTTGEGTVNGFKITNNIIYNAARDAITIRDIESSDGPPTDITIEGNTIISPALHGIRLNGGDEITIKNNVIRQTGGHGILFISGPDYTDISINNNELYDVGMDTSSVGVRLNPNDNTLTRVTVKDNRIVSKLAGSDMDKAFNTFIGGAGGYNRCVIEGNIVEGFTNGALNKGSNLKGCLLRDNDGFSDAQGIVPFQSPQNGDQYLDDGTNTSDSNPHYRLYDGSAWNDL